VKMADAANIASRLFQRLQHAKSMNHLQQCRLQFSLIYATRAVIVFQTCFLLKLKCDGRDPQLLI